MSDYTSNNKRIAKNTMFLYIRMFFSLIVSLYTSRVVLNTLGIVDYGVYNTVAGFVTMFAFLNSTLSASMQRFYNYEGARDGIEGYKRVYSVGILIHVIVMLIILVLLETIGIWYINNVMVVPEDRLVTANVVFQFSVASLCLLVMTIPYIGAVMASERMDFYAIVSVMDTLFKLLCILALPHLPFDKLSTYGALLLLISIMDFLAYSIYVKRKVLKFKLELHADKLIIKQLLSFSGWNVIGTFAFMLKGQALNMLLNYFFGPVINAARGVAYQINGAISSFSSNIVVAYRPQIVQAYSRGEESRVNFLFFSQSKICFALIALLITPIIIDIDYILGLWLGDAVPQYTDIFATLVLLDSLVCTLNAPCTQVVFATGNIKGYQIASSCVNLLLLPACWLFLYLDFDATSTFVITIIFSVLNQVVCVIQMLKVFNLNVKQYLLKVIVPCMAFISLCSLPGYLVYINMNQCILRLVCIGCVSVLWGSALAYLLLFDSSERKRIITMIKHK